MYFLNCFFIYSILGFILECLFTLITKNHFASGILYGPWTPVYGFGAILTIVISQKIFKNMHQNKIIETIVTFIILSIVLTFIEWLESKENIHIFENLESGQEYNITVKVTSNTGKVATVNKTLTTLSLKEPVFSETNNTNSLIRADSLTTHMINNLAGSLTLENIIVDGNNVASTQAMILVENETNVENGTLLRDANNQVDDGAAFLVNGGTLTMNGGEISNTTSAQGGAIFVNGGEEREDLDWEKGTLIINGGTFKNNVADGDEGAIVVGCFYGNCTDTNITGGNITNNTAGNLGGGIAVKSQATLKISGGTIDNNSSGYESTPYRFENLYFAIGLSLNEENIGMTLTRGKYYKIVSALNNSSAITLKNSTVSNGNDVILYSPITSSSQQWSFVQQ